MAVTLLGASDFIETSICRFFEEGQLQVRASLSSELTCALGIDWLLPPALAVQYQENRKLVNFPAITVFRLNEAVLTGRDHLLIDGKLTVLRDAVPEYVVNMHPHVESAGVALAARKVTDPALLITHWTSGTYGHFLLEMLPKLSIYPALKLIRPDLKVVISSQCGQAVLDVIRIFVSDADLIIYDGTKEEVRLDTLVMVSSCVRGGALQPIVARFVCMAQFRALQDPAQCSGERVYITKRKWRESRADYRIFTNEFEVEEEVKRFGFRIVVPEEMPWLQQVKVFSTASAICGEFSSALHGAVFAPRGAAVVAINYVNEMHDLIGASCGHLLSYILPSDGKPRRWTQESQDQAAQPFDISLVELRRHLEAVEALRQI